MRTNDARLPAMRTIGLIITETQDDLLVYDEEEKVLHTLNSVSRKVWQACDGSRTVPDIAVHTGIDQNVVEAAIEQLGTAKILAAGTSSRIGASQSRRRMLKRAGILTIPAVISITVPLSKAAASDGLCPDDCTGYAPGTPCSYSACNLYSCQYFDNNILSCIPNGTGQLTPS